MAEVISLEAKLTAHWLDVDKQADQMKRQAEYNLGRLATAYSDQLRLWDGSEEYEATPPSAA